MTYRDEHDIILDYTARMKAEHAPERLKTAVLEAAAAPPTPHRPTPCTRPST